MSSAVTKLTAVVGGGHSVMTGLAESLTWNCQQPWWQGFPMSPPLLPRPRPLHPYLQISLWYSKIIPFECAAILW